jgi:hypothetical protein
LANVGSSTNSITSAWLHRNLRARGS